MTIDPAGSLAKLVDAVIFKRLAAMCVAFPCKVVSFNEETSLAVVQPLLQVTDSPPSPIENVPVLGHKYRTASGAIKKEKYFLEKGDMVYVVCSDRQIKDSLHGNIAEPSSRRIHDRNDAVIVGVF